MIFREPKLRADLPLYPPSLQLLRIGATTVPGPSGYASSSFLGPLLYTGSTQQLRTDTILPRDREPCLVLDVNGYGLAPGYYLGRLSGSYSSLPVYEVVGGSGSMVSFAGMTPDQITSLTTSLSPSQIALLVNLNPCQLQVFLSLSVPQWQIITGGLTQTQITTLIGFLTPAQLISIMTRLNVTLLQQLTTVFNPVQVELLTQVFSSSQLVSLLTNLTTTQLLTLTTYTPNQMLLLFTQLTIAQLKTLLDLGATPLPIKAGGTGSSLIGTTTTTVLFDKTDTTLTNVTGLTADVQTGKTYTFRAAIYVTPSAGGGFKLSVSGTCSASNVIVGATVDNQSAGTVLPGPRVTSLGSTVATATGSSKYYVVIDGTITPSVSGTLTVQFAQASVSGTSSVDIGSSFDVKELS